MNSRPTVKKERYASRSFDAGMPTAGPSGALRARAALTALRRSPFGRGARADRRPPPCAQGSSSAWSPTNQLISRPTLTRSRPRHTLEEETVLSTIGTSTAPMAPAKPPSLNCPFCGHPLDMQQNATGTVYRCQDHGLFWFDDEGRLREERRSPARPRSVG